MHCADLSEHVIAVKRILIPRADVDLKGGRPGERAAQCPAWIRNRQRAKVDRCSVRPQEWRLLHQLALIPGGASLDGEPGGEAGCAGGLNAAYPVITTVDGYAEAEDTRSKNANLCVVPVLLIDRAIPLEAPVQPHRLPAQLVVGEAVGRDV